MTKDEALKLAREAIYSLGGVGNVIAWEKQWEFCHEALTAIERVLKQPEQEPVGHLYTIAGVQHCTIERVLPDGPLYTSPPARKWVGLTDEQYIQIADTTFHAGLGIVAFSKAIEAKLKEKNT
jgi:hypothetical protein